MGVRSLLLCGVSVAFPLLLTADVCKNADMQNETVSEDQPFAFNCTFPPITNRRVSVTWYKDDKIPLSTDTQLRIHQEQTWILFLPLVLEDSGMYHCIIKNINRCYRVPLNLTVFKKRWCDPSKASATNLSNEYIQTLYTGQSGSLTCHLHFPESCVLDSIKWYKGCEEIKEGKQYAPSGMKLFVNHTSAEDSGSYACTARLTHAGITYMVVNTIIASIKGLGSGRRIPNITYPRNNSIEVPLGSTLIVDCNITDSKENTNLRCWRLNGTLVDDYYSTSKRIREGMETNVSYPDHIFYTVNITFLEVKMEDYGLPFTCHAGTSAAYIILRLPVPDFQAYLIGGLVTLIVLIALLLCIYNNFKIDIVLWYRSAFLSTKAVEDGKLYDAYVLYPKCPRESQGHDVDTLVLKVLPEVLEKQCGYKLFIFGRDEFPGQAVANVIDENVKLCRRLIVAVAPELPSFGLQNMSAEQIAVYNALIQDGKKVILIELGKVSDYRTLPESIQYIKQKHGALQWKGEFTEQSQCARSKFWKRVRYYMPPRRFPPSSVKLQKHPPWNGTTGK